MFTTKKGNMFALFFIIHFITGSYLIYFLLDAFPVLDTLILNIGMSQIILVFLPALYYFFFFRTPIRETFHLNKTKLMNVVLSTLLAISSIPVVMLINVISQFFVKQALGDTLEQITNENFLLALLVIAVFPGIFEELIARGIILSHYKHKKILMTSTMSGFFFGMMHLNINQFLYAFFLGFLFSIVVHLTGSIFCSMIMHFIINGFNLGLAFLAQSEVFQILADMQGANEIIESIDQTQLLLQALPAVFLLVALSLPFLFMLVYALATLNNKRDLLFKNAISHLFFKSKSPDKLITLEETFDNSHLIIPEPKQPVITISLVFAFAIFLIMSIITELL